MKTLSTFKQTKHLPDIVTYFQVSTDTGVGMLCYLSLKIDFKKPEANLFEEGFKKYENTF